MPPELAEDVPAEEPPEELRVRLRDAIRNGSGLGLTVDSAVEAVLPMFADEHERARLAEQDEFTAERRGDRAEAAIARARQVWESARAAEWMPPGCRCLACRLMQALDIKEV